MIASGCLFFACWLALVVETEGPRPSLLWIVLLSAGCTYYLAKIAFFLWSTPT